MLVKESKVDAKDTDANTGWKPGDPIREKIVGKLPAPAKGNKLYYCGGEVPGFAVRVTAAGARSFVLNYYIRGRERRITIGRFPFMSFAEAREAAFEIRREVLRNSDPLERRATDREAPTVKDLADDYFAFYADKSKRGSSLRNDRSMVNNVIGPKLGRLTVAGVTARDIEALHSSLRATPYQANRVLALLSKMFSLAVEWKWRADNPAANVAHFPEEKRERWLSEEEIARLTAALAGHPNKSAANAIRLLLFTGSRKSEVLGARWEQFDLQRQTWTKPSAHTKQKRTEHVPLSEAAAKLLQEIRASAEEPFLFPGRLPGTHLQDLKADWKALCKAAKITRARIHDLRHTYASHLVSDGVPLAIVGKLLGHTQSQTTERYSHLAESPLREATNRFGRLVTAS